VLQTFFGLDAAIQTSDLDWVLRDVSPHIPLDILPIRCTDGDDFVCIDLRKRSCPVVYWDRMPFWGTDLWSEADLYPITDNFDQLLLRCIVEICKIVSS